MKIHQVSILLLSLATQGALLQAADADASPPAGREYIYKHTNGQPQELEVYFPAGHDPSRHRKPCLLLFHGGGWSGGDLSTFRYDCSYFASRGIVAATANYYMHPKEDRNNLPAGESHKRACVTDAKSAIRWMKQNAGKLGIDPDRIVVGGGSAGGHVSILATISPANDDPSDPLEYDMKIAGYVLFNPALSEEDAAYPEIDALQHLQEDFAPAVVFFGTEDKWKKGWDEAYGKLERLGVADRVNVWLAEGEEHAFFNRQPWKDLTIIQTDRFLSSLGFLKGEPEMDPPAGGARYKKENR